MSNFPPSRLQIQTEALLTRDPVSESLMQPIAGSVNSILLYNYVAPTWKINGSYKGQANKINAPDLFYRWNFNAQIINVVVFNADPGNSGVTEVDIKTANTPGGVFTSIFSTTPKVNSAAAQNVWCGIGETVTGMTAPVLTSSPGNLNVTAGDVMRMDLLQTMGGNPKGIQVSIYWLPRD